MAQNNPTSQLQLKGTTTIGVVCKDGVILASDTRVTMGFYVAHKFAASDVLIFVALYFIILEFLIICSLALLFSSFSSPLLSAVFAFALFVIGCFAEDLRGFAAMAHGVSRWLATGAAYLVPNLSALNVIGSVAHSQPVAGQLILANTAYALLYAGMALCGAVLIFERRNLK